MSSPDHSSVPGTHTPEKSKPSETLLLPDESPTLSWLVALNAPRRGKLYRIKKNGMTIGRAEDNDIILDDETISRHHARLLVEPGIGYPQIYIQDLASVNGVFVNGERIVRQLLHDEDHIAIGNAVFAFKHL